MHNIRRAPRQLYRRGLKKTADNEQRLLIEVLKQAHQFKRIDQNLVMIKDYLAIMNSVIRELNDRHAA